MDDKKTSNSNRLINEKSPYLLQHAHNPVEWRPWGEEAFELARTEDKPILLSIGYRSCHWCHVMEEEVFEDVEAASAINETFIPIKVDREERPDVDSVYMAAAQSAGTRGGWPLNIFLTPDKKPFFAATYIPKESRSGQMGMMDMAETIRELWKVQREDIEKASAEITSMISTRPILAAEGEGEEKDWTDILSEAYSELTSRFDPNYGGFWYAPKFPTPHLLSFLLRYWRRSGNGNALEMVETSLRGMRRGGVFDHLGYGFHRYSTDEKWHLPHFEKMLYDQALNAVIYVEAWQATGKDEYERTCREIMEYVLRDMRCSETGGFFSGEDADTGGVEGATYTWKESELRSTLSSEEADIVIEAFAVRPDGNFNDEATGVRSGTNVFSLAEDREQIPDAIREKLFLARSERERPFMDDKILTDWNGLMIASLSKAAAAFGDEGYASAAGRAADFILSELVDDRGRLLHRYRDGEAGIEAHADDYAFFIWGLMELYEATFNARYLKAAIDLNSVFIEDFWCDAYGGFYMSRVEATDLIVRQKLFMDNAYPSANSVAMLNLLKLSGITGDEGLRDKAMELISAFRGELSAGPSSAAQLLIALDFAVSPLIEVVIAGDPDAGVTKDMLQLLRSGFYPNKIVIFRSTCSRPEDDSAPSIEELAPFVGLIEGEEGVSSAYVCRDHACNSPTVDPLEMIRLLSEGEVNY